MKDWIEKYRGINPGAILDRQLKKRKIKQKTFAREIHVPAQTINAIIKGVRKMTPEVSLKIDHALGLPESTMAVLQAIYESTLVKRKLESTAHPDFSRIRKILFWDTDFDKINWQQQKNAVIRRVLERGNEEEKQEIKRYYGVESINAVIETIITNHSQRRHLAKNTSL
ncbi:helix-turn-helix domain-containing protein [Mucilaginibacter sp. RS28]|uniref:Helix-turn-helix domain-containing protein n=1 Tax=Mucilaginibacter straminoryzae TaxID=2932774 RepID=A0A9X1X646_9SPHI|nr:helix-turn-helix domain-containing protein [Mucilaginibacter straminoryzae]MCJ8210343.1 helix-turn-helix domain-containing protein [Mucilaginibacter straminoryzae]